MLRNGRQHDNAELRQIGMGMGGRKPSVPMGSPVNLKVGCPNCGLDLWIAGRVSGCKARDKNGPTHYISISDVIPTKTVRTDNGQDPTGVVDSKAVKEVA